MSESVNYRELAKIIGRDAAYDLIMAHGGQRVYVPSKEAKRSALAACIGAEACAKLQERYECEFVLIPARTNLIRIMRELEIGGAVVDGVYSIGDAAHFYGVSRTKVISCVKMVEKLNRVPCPQIELFAKVRA